MAALHKADNDRNPKNLRICLLEFSEYNGDAGATYERKHSKPKSFQSTSKVKTILAYLVLLVLLLGDPRPALHNADAGAAHRGAVRGRGLGRLEGHNQLLQVVKQRRVFPRDVRVLADALNQVEKTTGFELGFGLNGSQGDNEGNDRGNGEPVNNRTKV